MSTLAQPADIRNVASEFSALSDPEVQGFIDMADAQINPDAWGSRAKQAEIMLTCHLMTLLRRKGGAAGPITGTRVGDVAVQYAAPMSSFIGSGLDPTLATTSYGLAYAQLIKIAAMGVATTGGC